MQREASHGSQGAAGLWSGAAPAGDELETKQEAVCGHSEHCGSPRHSLGWTFQELVLKATKTSLRVPVVEIAFFGRLAAHRHLEQDDGGGFL